MKTFIIDASIALKWFLDDEENVKQGRQILTDIKNGEIEILLPSIWIYEVTNGFRSAVIKKRISKTTAKRYSKEIKELEFPTTDLLFLMDQIVEIALNYELSIYDALYIAFSNYKKCEFITSDKKLFNKLKEESILIKWLGDYNLGNGNSEP